MLTRGRNLDHVNESVAVDFGIRPLEPIANRVPVSVAAVHFPIAIPGQSCSQAIFRVEQLASPGRSEQRQRANRHKAPSCSGGTGLDISDLVGEMQATFNVLLALARV